MDKAEAKRLCIRMWKRIAENITDPEWRKRTVHDAHPVIRADAKWLAIRDMHVERPDCDCFLCQYKSESGLFCREFCPLSFGMGFGCEQASCSPYASVGNRCRKHDYKGAAASARRLVRVVEKWEVE